MSAATYAIESRGVAIQPQPDDPSAVLSGKAGEKVWRRLVESRAFAVVHDEVPASMVATLLGEQQSFCARVGGNGFEPGVLRSAERGLAWTAPWALVLDLAHVEPLVLAGVAARLPTYLLDARTDRLVRLPGRNGRLVDSFLMASWLETGACVVANAPATRDLLGSP
jgi:hypothetical protein